MILFALVVLGTLSSQPLPSPTASACADTQATVMHAVQPDIPRVQFYSTVTVEVSVAVGPDGAVKAVEILRSSGHEEIDAEVVKAASESKYKPKMVNCQPVDGTYVFRTDFQP